MAQVVIEKPKQTQEVEQTYEPKLSEIWDWASQNLDQCTKALSITDAFGHQSFCAMGAIMKFLGGYDGQFSQNEAWSEACLKVDLLQKSMGKSIPFLNDSGYTFADLANRARKLGL
jgi:hypothetical protein